MRLYSFFSGSVFIAEKFKHFYFYGNDSATLAFRQHLLKWWFSRNGYNILERDTIEGYQPEPDLFAVSHEKTPMVFLKKSPKSLDTLTVPCVWQAASTKNTLHDKALKNPRIAALACYELKPDDVAHALRYYLNLEFNITVEGKKLLEAGQILCHEPTFFFSEAYKIALGAPLEKRDTAEKDEDLIGSWRLRSAMILRQLKTDPTPALWQELNTLRHQERIFKSGRAATPQLIEYHDFLKLSCKKTGL